VSSRRKGFTLIELLVVTGIIALLIGIIVPSLASGRKSAERVVCAGNLRSICLALVFYADSNDDWLPPGVQTVDESHDRLDLSANTLYYRELDYDLPSILGPYVGEDALNCPGPRKGTYEGVDAATEAAYSNYLFLWRAANSFPIKGYKKLGMAPPEAEAVVDMTWLTYDGGRWLAGFNHIRHGFDAPRRAYVAARPDDAVATQYVASSRYWSPTLKPVHGLNAGYFDGSVQWVKMERLDYEDHGPLNNADLASSKVWLPKRLR
jgi:prepilin-type N-terminal cleavage/methylation domain-containing protein